MDWTVRLTAKANRQKERLPDLIRMRLNALLRAVEVKGPAQPSMPHLGKLKNRAADVYHCHLNKGRPTYVAVWEVKDRAVRLVEVYYVGTHEKAPY